MFIAGLLTGGCVGFMIFSILCSNRVSDLLNENFKLKMENMKLKEEMEND